MKIKLLFAVFLLSIGSSNLISQCTPNPMYADSIFGVWPDTVTNFPSAVLNTFYETTIDFKVPDDAGVFSALFAGTPIDSGVVSSVTGLPPGLDYECNSQTPAPCTFLGGTQGCAVMAGTPTQTGLFDLTINITGYVTVLFQVVPVPLTFEGYHIQVDATTGFQEYTLNPQKVSQNQPNPFEGQTTVIFDIPNSGLVEFTVHNILGERVYKEEIFGSKGENKILYEPRYLEAGIYMYSIRFNDHVVTKRMVYRK